MYNSYFWSQLCSQPAEKVFFYEGWHPVTCGQVQREALHVAAALQAEGMQRGDRVVVAAAPDRRFMVFFYAAMLLQAQVSIIDPEMGREHYAAKLRQFQPHWALIDRRLMFLQEQPLLRRLYLWWWRSGLYFPATPGLRCIGVGPALPLRQPVLDFDALIRRGAGLSAGPLTDGETDAEFLITYTSGTVDEPKGVVHTLASLRSALAALQTVIGHEPGQKTAVYLPLFALIGLHSALEVYLIPKSMKARAKLRFYRRHGINLLFAPPAEYLTLLQAGGGQLPGSLRHLMIGSAPVYPGFLQKLTAAVGPDVRISCTYGMTEHLLVATTDGRQKLQFAGAGDLLGTVASGVALRIAADGEIEVHSPQLFRRYFHQSDRPHWHATGDLGQLLPDGCLVMTGRKKDMIIRRDTNIYPGLYEPTINRIPGVRAAALVGVYDPAVADERVFLAVECDDHSLTAVHLATLLRDGPYAIDREAWPDEIHLLTLPRSGRQQKVDKHQLRLKMIETSPLISGKNRSTGPA
jgi:acyl-CoA synthetase (AMP-forming)/AMP-acid ligase II